MTSKYRWPAVQYWQVRSTGEIMEVSDAHVPSEEWRRNYRRVRLLWHEGSDYPFIEDWHDYVDDDPAMKSALYAGNVDELDLQDWTWRKTLYDNPDL